MGVDYVIAGRLLSLAEKFTARERLLTLGRQGMHIAPRFRDRFRAMLEHAELGLSGIRRAETRRPGLGRGCTAKRLPPALGRRRPGGACNLKVR
ncbi:MAG: hypothetical protein ACE5FS_15790 [Paracoccaceae bacterium]